ncbi:glycoside hydrolase family 15 protein [Acanthopleuribacter pedis]|uniref:Glycoside hydrolase family 15 protein n=1 Tax=Acanthopleuribacter pedis TaxID=442870 RepID=A0A8J7Q719_9BACT|nr:glycoside hydrolase family 15 protein [Acanthopleuribacter pedis]MBO1321757.1 glycoside hydrolase family 15 protein [Acanthopleuribacter pedis]
MDYGLVGNCQYNALIDPNGNVAWLCWPRFDSSFLFGGLLDSNHGGRFRISPGDDSRGEQSYLVNTNVLRTEFTTDRGRFEIIDFAPRFVLFERYHKPTKLFRIVRPLSGEPVIRVEIEPKGDYGRVTPTPVFGSNHIRYNGLDQELRLTTNASLSMIAEQRDMVLREPLYFVLSYGEPLEANLEHTCKEFLERTIQYWQTWVKHCYLPLEYQDAVIRSALVLKIHQFEDTGAIIAATTTSIPEAHGTVRNWDYRYCWMRDAMFSLLALQRLTQFEELEGFVSYLRNLTEVSQDGETRLQPVYGISGEHALIEHILDHLEGYRGHQPVRIGNQAYEHLQHDVYGELILAISQLFLDRRFINPEQGMPITLITRLLNHIETYLEAKDAGLWEFRGIAQLHTFTLLMHWAGASMVHQIGETHDLPELKTKAEALHRRASALIEDRCWDEQLGAYTIAAEVDALDASLLMMINLGYLDRDNPRAHRHVDAIARRLDAGNGLIHRYTMQDDFGATENAFLICSFWLAEAYARLGRRAEAEALFNTLLANANPLGLYSEDLDPKTGELWGNFPQTYSHVGLINAAFALARHDEGHGFFNPRYYRTSTQASDQ